MAEIVALARVSEPASNLKETIFETLESARISVLPGMRILVKPNLLTAVPLACTSPALVGAACEWLLERRARVIVADSPAFGSAARVAARIGLSETLKSYGLAVQDFSSAQKIELKLPGMLRGPRLGVAKEAIETDLILSMPKIKAHSQLRISLAVKNCYGTIFGLRKAIAHARFGDSVEYFCDCVAALWSQLPPVVALCDGITTMNGTGPIKGTPYPLNLIAASSSAPALDAAIMAILKLPVERAPLAQALIRRGVNIQEIAYPLLQPEDFTAAGFQFPETLRDISFHPLYLAKSLLKRIWLAARA